MFNFDVNALAAQIQPGIAAFASTLGVKADELWALGIKMEQVKGIFYTFVAAISLISCFFIPKIWKWAKKHKDESNSYDSEVVYAIPIIHTVATIVTLLTTTYQALIHILVPQYVLIMDILRYIQINT